MVEPAFDPLGAVAAVAEPVTFEFAVGKVTGEDERIHEASHFSWSFAGTLKWVKKSGGFLFLVQNGYKTVTKTARFLGHDL